MTTFSVNQSLFGLFCIIIDLMVQDLSVLHPLFHCCGTTSYSCLFEELVDFGIDQLLLDESFLEVSQKGHERFCLEIGAQGKHDDAVIMKCSMF